MTRHPSFLSSRPLVALGSSLCIAIVASADWASDSFPIKKHNFGTVAVAAKTEFRFPIENKTSRAIHIRTVRASCGCTTPIIETPTIEPGESGSILARFNTRTFKGKRGATLTVIIDRPYYTEVRLRVDGYIRGDMVFHPGSIDFGELVEGQSAEKQSKLMYAGRDTWKLLDIESNHPWLKPRFEVSMQKKGRIDYQITVDLTEEAPTGFFQDELIVVTNDKSMPRVPFRVTGRVESELSIAPRALALGSIKPGESKKQKLIIRGQEPFTIESLSCEGWKIEFVAPESERTTHILFVTLTRDNDSTGPQKAELKIATAGESSKTATAVLTANVRGE